MRCLEESGPLALRYCQVDATWSECIEPTQCNPLTQEGCPDGLACFFGGQWTFCVSTELYPCMPGKQWTYGIEGAGCQPHCVHDGRDGDILDAPECAEEEWCERNESLPEGVGTCRFREGSK